MTKTQPAKGAAPPAAPSRLWRSSSGSIRLDTPNASVITNPAAQHAIMLDHLKKEAIMLPMPPASPPALPGSPKMAAGAAPSSMQVEDLGKSVIEGHEVEGKRFTLPPMTPPQAPSLQTTAPQAAPPSAGAKLPQLPKLPKPPKPPSLPKPPMPTVAEIWSSVKLKTPVLTKVTSAAGEQTTYCKPTSTAEPHPSLFQIPPGYKLKKSLNKP